MYLPLRNSRVKLPCGQLFWHEIGHGPVLVFLHGSWYDNTQWLPVIKKLCGDHHCFSLDLLGFGESECANTHFSIALEVECLANYLETLKLRQVYLIGHSLGGWVAASYALQHPEQVKGLILLSPEGVKVPAAHKRWQAARWMMAQPQLALWILRALRPVAKLFKGAGKVDEWLQLREQLLRSPAAPQLLFKRKWVEIQAELLDERLPWLKLPVLILQGVDDSPVAVSLNESYAKLVPTVQLESVKPGGSNLPQQSPQMIAQYIREFVGFFK